ncbi:MAG: NAD(P)-dependent oxidoreductase [Abditibacteriaceae bacterium]
MKRTFRILNMADVTPFPQALDSLCKVAQVTTLPADQQLFDSVIGDYDGYFASLYVQATQEVLEHAPRLKVIATPSTGLDHVDMKTVTRRGIKVLSLKEETPFLESITSTAEMTWALLLAVVRRLPWSFEAVKNGHWARDEFRGHQLSGKTLGILGYGRLGRMVAEYGKAFGMHVLACDNILDDGTPEVTRVDFSTLLWESDIVSIHIHLTPENHRLFNQDIFAQMKPGAILLNTSRGAIIDETALCAALESGHLGGAGLDVIDGEWNPDLKNHPLIAYARRHQNLVITPHIGGVTLEAQRDTLEFTARKLADFLSNLG